MTWVVSVLPLRAPRLRLPATVLTAGIAASAGVLLLGGARADLGAPRLRRGAQHLGPAVLVLRPAPAYRAADRSARPLVAPA